MSTAEVLSHSMNLPDTTPQQWAETHFREVFLQHYSRIVAVLIRLLGDRTQAEELASDTLWKLYHAPALQADGNLGGWLYRTATNLGIDRIRAASRRQKYEEAAGQDMHRAGNPVGSPLEEVLREEQRIRVRGVLASIKPQQAQLLLLRATGFSYNELADALEVKPAGIGTMLTRAEEEFRKRYLELYGQQKEGTL